MDSPVPSASSKRDEHRSDSNDGWLLWFAVIAGVVGPITPMILIGDTHGDQELFNLWFIFVCQIIAIAATAAAAKRIQSRSSRLIGFMCVGIAAMFFLVTVAALLRLI